LNFLLLQQQRHLPTSLGNPHPLRIPSRVSRPATVGSFGTSLVRHGFGALTRS